MPISVMESVVSNAERRALRGSAQEIVPRISDIYAALPAITGKIELEYEGELVGAAAIARDLIRRAADATFRDRAGTPNLDDVILWFEDGTALQVTDDVDADVMARAFEAVPGLTTLVQRVGLAMPGDAAVTGAACELVLESLVARRKLSRSDAGLYGRAAQERRSRGGQQDFGGGLSA
jgi:magnesium chelatase subunit I